MFIFTVQAVKKKLF